MPPTPYPTFARTAAAEAGMTLDEFHAALASALPPDSETTPEARCAREWAACPALVMARAAAFGAPHLRERLFIVAYPEVPGLATDLLASRPPFCVGQDSTRWRWRDDESQRLGGGLGHTQYPPLLGDDGWPRALQAGVQPPCVERGVRGATYGTADGLDRTRTLGNAVLPDLAEFIGRLILEHAS